MLGEIRIGIFATRDLKAGEELTFDYQFERFGGKKQRCYCGESNCRGYLGEKPNKVSEALKVFENYFALLLISN